MQLPLPGPAPAALAVLALGLFAASPAIAGSQSVHAQATLRAYDAALPDGATARVDVEYDAAGQTRLDLEVAGLAPGTRYIGRAHVGGCTRRTNALGEVFQLSPNPDPESPNDPAFRNPVNEVWLDVETDRTGAGRVTARQPWQFHPTWRPQSVIIHSVLPMNRPTDPVVGPALGCLDVEF